MSVGKLLRSLCLLVAVGLLSNTAAWAIQAGIVFDVHQDIKNPDLWPNDFHVEGKIQSLVGQPTVIKHIDGPFTAFKWSITPMGGEDYWFECTWWMEEPGVYIPFCDVLHLAVLFDVDYKNIIIDVVSWWTRDGVPVGGKAGGALYNNGYAPVIGFNVEDLAEPQMLTIANGFVTGTPPPPPSEAMPPWPPAPIKLDIVQLQVAAFDAAHQPDIEALYAGGPAESLPWINIVRADSSEISIERPLSIDPGVSMEVVLSYAPRSDALRAAQPFTIEPGGFLVIREQAGFINNSGEYEKQWFWEIHGSQPTEACCFPDGTCQMLQPFFCLEQGGTPMGAGTICDMMYCPVSIEPGACCYGTADPPQCVVTDVLKCRDEYLGTWHGPGTNCDDLNGNGVADICEPATSPLEACCMPDGTCKMMTPKDCLDARGEPQGPGSACVGDWDGNGVDETCEAKWLQPPDVDPTGIDVKDTRPMALADDFLCTETNAITKIVVWGSWLRDQYPYDPANVDFTLMLREDIPDPDGPGPAFSMPGKILWARSYRPYTFRVETYRKDIQEACWDPQRPDSYVFPGDTVCWMYTFDVPVTEAFCQQGTTTKPIVYWLDVQATIPPYPGPAPVVFGWKTSTKHWNDAAVWQYRSGGIETPFHELRYPKPHPWAGQRIDLAFALETEPCVELGACCLVSGCTITTQMICDWGVWMGPGTNCDDLDGDGVADICEPITPQACCFLDGTCSMLIARDCEAAGGTPMGDGTDCASVVCPVSLGACCWADGCRITTEGDCYTGPYEAVWMGPGTNCDDLDGDGVADICEPVFLEACCDKDGACRMMPPLDCREAGGEPQGPGSACVGDWDGNGADETCEAKWIQPPDLARTGIDVDDSFPLMLADDFLCTETNAITRIFVWASWLNDVFPEDPANVDLTLAFHEDIPDPDGTGPAYSMPGKLVWTRNFKPGTFAVREFQGHIEEGFWDPRDPTSYIFPGDTVCWLYIFDIPLGEAFCQQGSASRPIVYWLSVQATPGPSPLPVMMYFGWKTSTTHWNDDAVFCQNTGPAVTPWFELRYPKGHPWEGKSIDLSFALETQPCVVTPGEPEAK